MNITAEYGELMALLVAEAALSTKQVSHAGRIREKLGREKPLLDIVLELGYVGESQVWDAIRKHKVSMRIGTLLVELGLLKQNELDAAFAIQQEEGSGKKIGEILVSHHFIKETKS